MPFEAPTLTDVDEPSIRSPCRAAVPDGTTPSVAQERVVAPAADANLILARLEDAVAALRTWLRSSACSPSGAWRRDLRRDARRQHEQRLAQGPCERRARHARRWPCRSSQQAVAERACLSPCPTAGASADSTALAARLDTLERAVRTLSSCRSTDATHAVKALSSRLDTLSRDIDELKQAQTQTTP
jgi:hypothetical protein